MDEYALYVKEAIHVGMLVRLHDDHDDEEEEKEEEEDVGWVNLGYVKKVYNFFLIFSMVFLVF